MKSRESLVCFVQGSDDIVGLIYIGFWFKVIIISSTDGGRGKKVVVSASVYVAEKFVAFEHFQSITTSVVTICASTELIVDVESQQHF